MRPKYNNKKTMVDGILFHSQKEASRYGDLKILQKAKKISDLKLQVKYPLEVNGQKVCTYIADFEYVERGTKVVEDVKGMKTALYSLKKKLLKACTGIEIFET